MIPVVQRLYAALDSIPEALLALVIFDLLARGGGTFSLDHHAWRAWARHGHAT